MIRKIDKLGHLVIPKEMRKTLCLEIGSAVLFKLSNDSVTISPVEQICKICNGRVGNDGINGICPNCLAAIKKL